MSMQLRYAGEFLSRASVTWRVEILQDADEAFASVGDLTFEADEAIEIEWETKDKEEAICSSTATMKIISPDDRTYEDLYTIEAGKIRADIYRNGVLYWSGALDPEFYEEPYEQLNGYTVELTFSDFGILDRLSYNLSGVQTLEDLLLYALERSVINYSSVDYDTYSSTYFTDGEKANLAALSIQSENFYDEDGEPCTMEEVIEGILLPLGLRIIQRAGTIYVYDLNGLYNAGEQREIEWDGDSSTMGVDKVANNAKITFSPYSSAEVLNEEIEYTDDYSVEAVNLTSTSKADDYGEYYSYYPNYSDNKGSDWDYYNIDFTIFLSNNGTGVAFMNTHAKYFHILPLLGSGDECSGIAWSFYTGGHGSLESGYPTLKLNSVSTASTAKVFTTNRVFIPKLSADDAAKYYVRLAMEMLLDARYNPFSDGDEYNEEKNYNYFQIYSAWVLIPIAVEIYDADGNVVCHYDNSEIALNAATGHKSYAFKGKWVSGAASHGDAWLEWYDPEDIKDSAGILGFKANRHCIGRLDSSADTSVSGYFKSSNPKKIYEHFSAMDDGEYMPYPEQGGYMEVSVYAGAWCYNEDEGEWGETDMWTKRSLYDKIRWMLYKAPTIEIVKNNLVFDEAELDDIEYTGYINKAAKDEITIDTICGTANQPYPTAKGIYHRASDDLQITELVRAGYTNHPEMLFIGTLYSQFAERKTKLSGEAVIDPDGLGVYTEQNQSGKLFLMTGEVQDVIADTSEITVVELRPDEYEGIEEVED